MKKYSILLAMIALILASLACQTVMGGDNGFEVPDVQNVPGLTEVPQTEDSGEISTIPPVITDGDGGITVGGDSKFPMPDDAFNVISVGSDVTNFQTKLSLEEGMNFYKDQFGKLGYTERDLLTVTSSTTFSMVYDGHESGKAIIVQGVDLGDGTINISITLQDI
jgi:hypothetical protein